MISFEQARAIAYKTVGPRWEPGCCGEYTVADYGGVHSRLDGPTRCTVVHSCNVALFLDTRPVDAVPFHHDLLGTDEPANFFTLSR